MSTRRLKVYKNLGGGRLRYPVDHVQSVDSVAIEDPFRVLGTVELLDYQLGSESGDPPYTYIEVVVNTPYFPVLVVSGDWKAPDDGG